MVDHIRAWDQAPEGDNAKQGEIWVVMDYYQHAFDLFHQELAKSNYRSDIPHPIRKRYWHLLPYREYEPFEGRGFLLQYLKLVESELASIICKHSLAYWLHLYRRLAPGAIGTDKQPYTIGLTRATLEAAIHKYALFQPCSRVGLTDKIPIDKVFNGLLLHPEFEHERKMLEYRRQLVLTDFGTVELREFYDVERLAYEVWRSSALLRVLGKGAPLVVAGNETSVFDARSSEIERLITIFDHRLTERNNLAVSATGVMFAEDAIGQHRSGVVFLPNYNLKKFTSDDLEELFAKVFKIKFQAAIAFNFIWVPFNLRDFRLAHQPFAEAFRDKHGVKLDAVLAVLAALCSRVFHIWIDTKGVATMRYWQRAYEGAYTRDYIADEIRTFLPSAFQILELDSEILADADISDATRFLELDVVKRSMLDLAYPGPHAILLPYGDDRLFIDYAWIIRRLYDLFVGVSIPDQNFKGDALERIVRFKRSVLPINPCKAGDEEVQIDAAFEVEKRLVIVECKAVGRSIGFDRGQSQAIQFREQMIDQALDEVDQKARWLSFHPQGSNYDIRQYQDILPVVVTPFIEYIPSLSPRYWLTEILPRVMTPRELKDSLTDGTFLTISGNNVLISLFHQ